MSLNACLDAPIRPPRSREDFGVKNRVKVLGVIVGALRGLLPCCLPRLGSTGDEPRCSPLVEAAELDGGFSWDPSGVCSSISTVSDSHSDSTAVVSNWEQEAI